jgi:hypothetical protein
VNINIAFCCLSLREIRKEAKLAGVRIPKNLTALKSGVGSWYLVEGDGGFREEVCADNAYDAKQKVIAGLINRHQQAY